MTPAELEAYLLPVPITGEVLRFDLAAFRSTVTREMLQIRVRMTPVAFGVGTPPVGANVSEDGAALEVDAAALAVANAEVAARLDAGAEGAVVLLRRLSAGRTSVDRVAAGFAARLSRGARPGPASFLAYVEACAHYQALGALKFCMPADLRPRVSSMLDDDDELIDALLSPDGPTMWSVVRGRELALARARAREAAGQYRRRLERHRREYGYLSAEDVDFRAYETLDALDARVAALGPSFEAERRQLAAALAHDRSRKVEARKRFAQALHSHEPDGGARLVSHVLLARALAEHEDRNRRAKMRFLRDLRDLAARTGLDLEHDGLLAFAGQIAAAPAATVGPTGVAHL